MKQQMKVSAAAVAAAPKSSGCQCPDTRHSTHMLNWTWICCRSGYVQNAGYSYQLKAKCRVCRKVPPPATKTLLRTNLYATMSVPYSSPSLTPASRIKFESILLQRRTLEESLLKSFIDGNKTVLREAALTGINILGHDVTGRFAHPLWCRESECKSCATKATQEDILASVSVSSMKEGRVGFKMLHLGSVNVRMICLKAWSQKSSRDYLLASSFMGKPVTDPQHVLRHSASCVALPKHPTINQLQYLAGRGLVKFAYPSDYVSFSSESNDCSDFLRSLEATAIDKNTTKDASLVSILEVSRDEEILPQEVIFGSKEVDLLRRLVLEESRLIDLFFAPLRDRERESNNPFPISDSRNRKKWSELQTLSFTHWRSVALSVHNVELSDEHEGGALFWCKLQKDQLFASQIKKMACAFRDDEATQTIEVAFLPSIIKQHVRLKKYDTVYHMKTGNVFVLSTDTKDAYLRNSQKAGASLAPHQLLNLRYSIDSSFVDKQQILPPAQDSTAGLKMEDFGKVFNSSIDSTHEKLRKMSPTLWQGDQNFVSEGAKRFIVSLVRER